MERLLTEQTSVVLQAVDEKLSAQVDRVNARLDKFEERFNRKIDRRTTTALLLRGLFDRVKPSRRGHPPWKSNPPREVTLQREATRTLRKGRLASFDLNGCVPVIENVFGVLVLNAPRQMIMKTDTDLCIVKGLCCSETARNYASCSPFLALQTLDCVNGSLRDSGVLN